ncbi:MAG: amidohydrolase family protein [Chloroflexi bacterium]|nr:amidohydrolase family protein [Chloroflexota bacterium]
MLIDMHLHTTRIPGIHRQDGGTYATPDELIAIMDRIGVARGVLLPLVSPECDLRYSTTEEIIQIAHDYPERFIPFANLDPRVNCNSPKTDLRRHLDYFIEQGCRGLGEVTCNLPIDDPRVINLFSACDQTGLSLTLHIAPEEGGYYGLVDAPGLPGLEAMLQRFPNCRIVGHSQPFWAEMSTGYGPQGRNGYPKGPVEEGGRLPELFERYPNLYGDLSAGSGYNAISRDEEFGYHFLERFSSQLLFATDICDPTNDTPLVRHLNGALAKGKISQATYEAIGWRNAEALMASVGK